jgi:hypothetical protein
MIDWHRLLGLLLRDFFTGSPWIVEVELDLSVRKQLLDILIVHGGKGTFSGQLPDGLAPLAEHNLISYKSLRQPLDDWTLKELTGHYTNYRKQVSPPDQLLPEALFRMIGLSTRFPQKLAGQLELKPVQAGVYDVRRGTDTIRVIVLSQIPKEPYNSLWHLFSGVPETVQFGVEHYRPRTEVSTALYELFENYQVEGLSMPYTMEDLEREVARKHLQKLTVQERIDELLENVPADELLERLTPEERLAGLSSDERLTGLSSDERLAGLSSDERLAGLSSDDLLRHLSPDQIRAFLKRLEQQENGQSNGNGAS